MDRYFSSAEEPRLVMTMGHWAPTMKPAILALQVTVSILPMMLPAWMLGATSTSQSPAQGLSKPLNAAISRLTAQS